MPEAIHIRLKPQELETYVNLSIRIESVQMELTTLEAKREEILDGARRSDRELKTRLRTLPNRKSAEVQATTPPPGDKIDRRPKRTSLKKRMAPLPDNLARTLILGALKNAGEALTSGNILTRLSANGPCGIGTIRTVKLCAQMAKEGILVGAPVQLLHPTTRTFLRTLDGWTVPKNSPKKARTAPTRRTMRKGRTHAPKLTDSEAQSKIFDAIKAEGEVCTMSGILRLLAKTHGTAGIGMRRIQKLCQGMAKKGILKGVTSVVRHPMTGTPVRTDEGWIVPTKWLNGKRPRL